MLLAVFGSRRPTVDADALARNMAADQETVRQRVTEIASLDDPDDGVEFLTGTASTSIIRDDALYAGGRVTMTARIATAQVKLRLDINVGDPVTPGRMPSRTLYRCAPQRTTRTGEDSGPDAERLPEHFGQVIDAVITFADPLIKDGDPDDVWNPQHRLWEKTAR
jgi:hypothetical protein